MPRPRSIVYMGPPRHRAILKPHTVFDRQQAIRRTWWRCRTRAVIQHQNTAPGPPRATAVETPTILPVPMVAASAVASAPNCEMSPLAPSSALADIRMARNVCRWMNRRRNVRNKCVPNSSTIMGAPQMRSRSQEIALAKNMIDLPFLFSERTPFFFWLRDSGFYYTITGVFCAKKTLLSGEKMKGKRREDCGVREE